MATSGAREPDDAITGINVTPLVDVVLVLLVVLMVTAGYVARRTMPVELPPAVSHDLAPPRALDIVVDAGGRASIDGELVSDADLQARIRSLVADSPEGSARASVSADRTSAHGDVVRVLDLLQSEHVTHVAIGVRPATR